MKYNANLDTLRALAAFAVLGMHYEGPLPVGWIAVQLFFVLSGMLISDIIIRAKAQGDRLTDFIPRFFARRAVRLIPVYVFYLVCLFLAFRLTGSPRNFASAWPSLATYTQNFRALFPSYQGGAAYWHLWTLSVEWQFYLLWPFALWAVPASSRRWFLVALFVLGPAVRFTAYWLALRVPALTSYHHPNVAADAVYILPFCQSDAFALGALLCDTTIVRWLGRVEVVISAVLWSVVLGIVALWASGGQYASATLGWPHTMPLSYQFVWGYSVLNFLSASVIAWILVNPPSFVQVRWLQRVGRVSYGFYIFHMAAVLGATHLLSSLPDHPAKSLVGLVLAAVLAIAAASLSYALIENPLMAWSRSGKALPGKEALRR